MVSVLQHRSTPSCRHYNTTDEVLIGESWYSTRDSVLPHYYWNIWNSNIDCRLPNTKSSYNNACPDPSFHKIDSGKVGCFRSSTAAFNTVRAEVLDAERADIDNIIYNNNNNMINRTTYTGTPTTYYQTGPTLHASGSGISRTVTAPSQVVRTVSSHSPFYTNQTQYVPTTRYTAPTTQYAGTTTQYAGATTQYAPNTTNYTTSPVTYTTPYTGTYYRAGSLYGADSNSTYRGVSYSRPPSSRYGNTTVTRVPSAPQYTTSAYSYAPNGTILRQGSNTRYVTNTPVTYSQVVPSNTITYTNAQNAYVPATTYGSSLRRDVGSRLYSASAGVGLADQFRSAQVTPTVTRGGSFVSYENSRIPSNLKYMNDDDVWKLHEDLTKSKDLTVFERKYTTSDDASHLYVNADLGMEGGPPE